ncbi:MAG: alpha/beta hydrolase [Chloroflexota bacterium]|nr:alpha/beta hydrolase [Chloroflexota bacterium]
MVRLTFGFLHLSVCALVVVLSAILVACEEAPAPSPVPVPDTLMAPTPAIEQVIEGQTFTISLGERLLATEELHADRVDGRLILSSDMQWHLDPPTTQRRTLMVSDGLDPERYDLESTRLGARSVWVGERSVQGMDCLNNNLDWVAPVLFEGVAPSPEIMLERAPSALPFVLMMLRYQRETGEESGEALSLNSLDIMEDYPVSRPLTVTFAPDRQGAVIGTTPLKGQIEDGPNPNFVLWFRPERQTLYRVEIPDYQFGFWDIWTYRELGGADLIITNVSSPPERPTAAPRGEARRIPLAFEAEDGTSLRGTLILPPGEERFPCLVVHSEGGVLPRRDPGDGPAERGWAVYCYDKRGLGESGGDYRRGPLHVLAQDAAAAADMLSGRREIDPDRIVFFGMRKGGQVGALAVAQSQRYAAAILSSCASTGDIFPGPTEYRIRHALAPFYGWSQETVQAYLDHSLEQWQTWLYEGESEVSLLGRRASLVALEDSAATDLYTPLSEVQIPVLLLHGDRDSWTPVEGAVNLHTLLMEQGQENISLHTFKDLGSLKDEEGGLLAPEADKVLFAWLDDVLSSP